MKNRRGVTLIELLVAMSVSCLMLIALLGIFGFSTRQLGTQTGRAQTVTLANQAMNAVCKEIGQAVSDGTDQNGDFYILPPASIDLQGNAVGSLVGGTLIYAASTTGVKFYPSNATGATQGSNTGGALTGITCLWRATSNSPTGTPNWQSDATWSRMPNSAAMPKYADVSSLTFSTTGAPANTVRVTLVMTDKEGGQTSGYTVSRSVYLSNHN